MELSKKLKCISMRNGIEKWAEEDRVNNLMEALQKPNCPQFINLDGELINRVDIIGVFNADTMADHKRRKNGQWQCHCGKWNDKFEKCKCIISNSKQIIQGMVG
jgi:hypothetical protein